MLLWFHQRTNLIKHIKQKCNHNLGTKRTYMSKEKILKETLDRIVDLHKNKNVMVNPPKNYSNYIIENKKQTYNHWQFRNNNYIYIYTFSLSWHQGGECRVTRAHWHDIKACHFCSRLSRLRRQQWIPCASTGKFQNYTCLFSAIWSLSWLLRWFSENWVGVKTMTK